MPTLPIRCRPARTWVAASSPRDRRLQLKLLALRMTHWTRRPAQPPQWMSSPRPQLSNDAPSPAEARARRRIQGARVDEKIGPMPWSLITCAPTSFKKAPQISPIFTTDKVTLPVSRERDGNLGLA